MRTIEGTDVIEAKIAKASAPEKVFCLYTSLCFKNPHIYVSPLSPSHRELLLVMSLEPYGLSSFSLDFNLRKPDDFANITLSASDSKTKIRVDRSEVEIREPRLTSDGSRVILHGLVSDSKRHGGIRIARRLEEFRFDFAYSHARILRMKGLGGTIVVSYKLSSREPYSHVREIKADPIDQPGEPSQSYAEKRFIEIDRSRMSRNEIRAWIDTEGHIEAGFPGQGGAQIIVSQKYREPLDAFARGVGEFGVRCTIATDRRTGQYVARIVDIEGVARVISEVGPFRSPRKSEQVRRLIDYLVAPRKVRRRVVERAKGLLGL